MTRSLRQITNRQLIPYFRHISGVVCIFCAHPCLAGQCQGKLLAGDIMKLNRKYYGGQKIISFSNGKIHVEKFQMVQPIAYVVEPNDYVLEPKQQPNPTFTAPLQQLNSPFTDPASEPSPTNVALDSLPDPTSPSPASQPDPESTSTRPPDNL